MKLSKLLWGAIPCGMLLVCSPATDKWHVEAKEQAIVTGGFADVDGVTGGGVLDENSEYYVKVTNAEELAKALKKGSKAKVIEIMNDIDLGWNVIGELAQTSPITENKTALTHPTLIETGVSKVTVDGFDGLTIYSKNGAKLTHAGFVFKRSNNVVIRNLEFDELWEWDEYTKGKYDRNDWDFITLENTHNVWIDHCTFGKAYDGVVDVKKGSSGVTISWSEFLPADQTEGSFYDVMFDEMEANPSDYKMYQFLRNQGLSEEVIRNVAAPQKKTHLVGANELASDNSDLELTLHHNYYLDTQDRIPRLRGGNAHVYNVVIDSTNAYEAGKEISDKVASAISKAGYSFQVTSNGAISTEGGAVLIEDSVISGIQYPIRNNQKSASKENYTGKILAQNVLYTFEDTYYQGNSIDKDSPLSPIPAKLVDFSWNGFEVLPYTYTSIQPDELTRLLTASDGAGAGNVSLSTKQWLNGTQKTPTIETQTPSTPNQPSTENQPSVETEIEKSWLSLTKEWISLTKEWLKATEEFLGLKGISWDN